MNIVKINKEDVITSALFESGNIYIIEYNHDIEGTVVFPENVTLRFNGGYFNSGTIQGNNTIVITETECFGTAVVFDGTFIQGNLPVFGLSKDIDTINLPEGFKVKTLGFYKSGDYGDATFYRINKTDFKFYNHFCLRDVLEEDNLLWCMEVVNGEIKAESVGIKANIHPNTQNDICEQNARFVERVNAHKYCCVFRGSYNYWINNVCVDNAIKIAQANGIGNIVQYYANSIYVIVKGDNEINRARIYTNESNFSYATMNYDGMNSFICENIDFYTTDQSLFVGTEEASTGPYRKRKGFGFTKFQKGLTKEQMEGGITFPTGGGDISCKAKRVSFNGFLAGFYSDKYATSSECINVTFSCCYYGFYSKLAANIGRFEYTSINECICGIHTGGDKCILRYIDMTPNCAYIRHKDDWNEETKVIGVQQAGLYALRIEHVYVEDYSGRPPYIEGPDGEQIPNPAWPNSVAGTKKYIYFDLDPRGKNVIIDVPFVFKEKGTNVYAHINFRESALDGTNMDDALDLRECNYPMLIKGEGKPIGIKWNGQNIYWGSFENTPTYETESHLEGSLIMNKKAIYLKGKPQFAKISNKLGICHVLTMPVDDQVNVDFWSHGGKDGFLEDMFTQYKSPIYNIPKFVSRKFRTRLKMHKEVGALGIYRLYIGSADDIPNSTTKEFESYERGGKYWLDIDIDCTYNREDKLNYVFGFLEGRYGYQVPDNTQNEEDWYELLIENY